MNEVEQTFCPPVFIAEFSKINRVLLNDESGSLYPYEVDSVENWCAFYTVDQEFLDLLKKRQPLYVLGTLPEEFQTRKEG